MTPLVTPDDSPRDILDRVACLADFLAESMPCWLDNIEMGPPSPSAVQGLSLVSSLIADMVREAARRVPPSKLAA